MLLEGNVSVKAAILGNHRKVEKLYYDKHKNDKDLNFILHRAKEKGIPCMPLEREEINAMATGRTHGGLVAEASPRVYQELSECMHGKTPFLVLLEGVEDPFNLGYIIRTLYSAGCDGLILPRHDWASAESTIAKSSAGAFEYMNIVMSDDLPQLVKDIKKQGVKTYAAMRKDAITYLEADYRKPSLIAIGGEMRGLSSAVRNEIEQNIYIPYANDFRNALNAASAAAVLSFEVYRQRR
ncbi:RNA methyltransferase [Solobacterium sp.]|uniref:TrmH family RNA methyltransferase n=1 Tax=Solobacterium sp. TaxID=2060878 RepID=UPI001CB42967|nr:RNA methyltransferase [Solobacterium sp.]MBF1088955.1 RNA methyltransferase [Solobacterium sp.]MBF1100113.1 RNA methyltransferase [Solobacterium sp.]